MLYTNNLYNLIYQTDSYNTERELRVTDIIQLLVGFFIFYFLFFFIFGCVGSPSLHEGFL